MVMVVLNSLTPLPVASLELKKDSTYPLKQNYTHHLQSTKDTAYEQPDNTVPVSYTHLTLPTRSLV